MVVPPEIEGGRFVGELEMDPFVPTHALHVFAVQTVHLLDVMVLEHVVPSSDGFVRVAIRQFLSEACDRPCIVDDGVRVHHEAHVERFCGRVHLPDEVVEPRCIHGEHSVFADLETGEVGPFHPAGWIQVPSDHVFMSDVKVAHPMFDHVLHERSDMRVFQIALIICGKVFHRDVRIAGDASAGDGEGADGEFDGDVLFDTVGFAGEGRMIETWFGLFGDDACEPERLAAPCGKFPFWAVE